MSLLSTLKTDDAIQNETDSVGSGGVLDSGCYESTVAMAYTTKSKGGAVGLVLHLKTAIGRELRQTLWMSSGDSKGNKNYYERDGERFYLPGFNMAQSLSLLTVGKELKDLAIEQKVVKVYSSEAKKEVPTQVEVVTELLGQEIIAGVFKQIVNKNALNQSTGKYEATSETREENEIDKFFRASDRMTTAEIRSQETEAGFYMTWVDKWQGQTRDRTAKTTKNTGNAGMPGATANTGLGTAAASPSPAPSNSLFGAK